MGSLVLWGRPSAAVKWEFQTVATDWSACKLDENGTGGWGPDRTESAWVPSWAEAIKFLDAQRWELLVPGLLHPEFHEATLAEVSRRLLERNDELGWRMMKQWRTACGTRKAA